MADNNLNNASLTSDPVTLKAGRPLKVGIVGGGVAGSTIAIRLAALGVETYLFEAKSSLIDGPPMCHLHAGGNLYREIPDEDCIELLKQSVDMVRMYPFSIDVRPTVIAIPTRDEGNPLDLMPRLELLTREYRHMVEADPKNKVLGDPDDYFTLYEREELERLIAADNMADNAAADTIPHTTDEWVAAAAKQLDLNKLKYPIVAVMEYGWNIFRLAASAHIALQQYSNAHLLLNAKVTTVIPDATDYSQSFYQWQISYEKVKTDDIADSSSAKEESVTVDYLINACGFRTGEIDNMVGIPATRMVEFKASYVAYWDRLNNPYDVDDRPNSVTKTAPVKPTLKLPEIIIHGKRGTPHGMVQLTPYPHGFYQIHSMGKDVTLFNDGLVTTKKNDAQPKLKPTYLDYIEEGWDIKKLKQRTQRAIAQVSEFVPSFALASPTNNALYGGQQIPGKNDTLRVADVSLYPDKHYARAENVKATSALLAADYICDQLQKQNLLIADPNLEAQRHNHLWHYLQHTSKADIDSLSEALASERHFPVAMSGVVTPLANI